MDCDIFFCLLPFAFCLLTFAFCLLISPLLFRILSVQMNCKKLPVAILLLLPCLAAISVVAQTGWWRWQNPRPQGNPVYAIAFSDARRGIAAGRDGTILRTADGGATWLVARRTLQTPLYGLSLSGRRAWAVGARGAIITTRDDGDNWTEQKSGTRQHLYAVRFIDEKRGWAVGVEGLVLATTDGGITWTKQSSGTGKHLYAVAFADDRRAVPFDCLLHVGRS